METSPAKQQRRAKVNGDGGKGAAPVDPDAGAAVLLLIQTGCHDGNHRRPHAGVSQTVDRPQKRKPIGVFQHGNTQIHGRSQQEANQNDVLGLEPVTQPTAEDLSGSVSNGGEGQRQCGGLTGGESGVNQIHHDRCQVDPGKIADKIDSGT